MEIAKLTTFSGFALLWQTLAYVVVVAFKASDRLGKAVCLLTFGGRGTPKVVECLPPPLPPVVYHDFESVLVPGQQLPPCFNQNSSKDWVSMSVRQAFSTWSGAPGITC